ncbi:hypothetical protein T492DRAFT_844492 [Pavlovales sp. CCMP2436]|nr:hypothetical protein T492DRAFT_844492 [Pavlovales sp. CCMP2436]
MFCTVVASLLLAVRLAPTDDVYERTPPPLVLTHADWLCYAQRHPLLAARYGMRTYAIRKYYNMRGRKMGHTHIRCDESFTLPGLTGDAEQQRRLTDSRQDCRGRRYGELYQQFHTDGYAIVTPCSFANDPSMMEQLSSFVRAEGGRERLQDRWKTSDPLAELVTRAATDPEMQGFLSFLHNDAQPVPFQTLNFKYGTAQPAHSDVVHFDTLPVRGRMTASWLALEDIHANSGPLFVYPGSQRLGLWDQAQLGLEPDLPPTRTGGVENITQYMRYHERLASAMEAAGLRQHVAQMLKGDVIVWAASVIHGGTAIVDPGRTRLSMVTHYWLEPASHFWVPRLSPEDKHLHCKRPENWQQLADRARERMAAAG